MAVYLDVSPALGVEIASEPLITAAQAVVEHDELPDNASLTIVITDDETVHQLNQQYLNEDKPTDVLSFPSGDPDPETGDTYLGDVVIAYPYASRQAKQAGHAIMAELELLVVHGTLHLLGYDHLTPEEKAEMWQIQDEILTQLGCVARPME